MMNSRTNTFLLTVVIVCIGIIFVLNFFGLYWDTGPKRFLTPTDVRGMAVEHNGKLFTLNFDQQNHVVAVLNQAVKVGSEKYFEAEDVDFGYERLLIYRFEEPDLEMTPLAFINQQLLFRLPEWNPNGLIRETGPGELDYLLSQTYDP